MTLRKHRSFGKLGIVLAVAVATTSASFAQLVGAWALDGDATATVGTNGTVFGAVDTEDRFGTPNAAMSFDGNDYIQSRAAAV